MKVINDILETMTIEEIAEHQDLIKECIEREKNTKKYSKMTKDSLEKLDKICDKMNWDIQEIHNAIQNINLTLLKTDGGIN